VLRLLTGAFKNYTGHVLLNSAPVANYDVANLRRNTGILLGSQDIFQGTLWENLTMGNDAISLQQVNELCEITGLINFVKSSAKGYDTQLLPVGNKLSENVRRNILLVRALLAEHKLLLLEEPLAHLPAENKAKMIAYIRKDAASTTLIASQDETLGQYCDQVIQLSPEGEVQS
jgi:ABC-type bacteriocin/lantibiotic exporter with double-glycine peptidase domain